MKHTIRHHLGLERSRELAVQAWEHYSRLYARNNPSLRWIDENKGVVAWTTFVGGVDLQCTVELRERSAELEMDVPLLMRPLVKVGIALVEAEVARFIKSTSG
jgi:hypothetical protein